MGLVVSRETQHMGVPYYVDKGFEKVYRGASLDELEKTIESDYIEHLQNGCWKEKQQSKQAFDVFYSAATGGVQCCSDRRGCSRSEGRGNKVFGWHSGCRGGAYLIFTVLMQTS